MDTEAIRLFVRAAEMLNISAAGRELGMAPAVASAKLAKLEKSLGADLLHRSTRKVALSLEGAEFLPFARELLAQEDAAFAALGKGNLEATGTLRFTAPSTFAQLYIAPILPAFMQRHPKVHLDLRLTDTEFDLIEGSFDLALRYAALPDSSLKARKLADDVLVLCASPAYLEQHGAPPTPEALGQHQLIAFRGLGTTPLVAADGRRGEFDPRTAGSRLTIDDGASQRLATIAGAGISLNALWSVKADLDSGALIRVLPDYQADTRAALWLVYPQSNALTAKVRVFIDFLLEHIGQRPTWLQ